MATSDTLLIAVPDDKEQTISDSVTKQNGEMLVYTCPFCSSVTRSGTVTELAAGGARALPVAISK